MDTTTLPDATTAEDLCRHRLADLWWELMAGETTVTSHFNTEWTCHAVFTARRHQPTRPLPATDIDILGRSLLGTALKVVASELELSQATVSTSLKRTLLALRIERASHSLPLFLAVLAHAALSTSRLPPWRGRVTLHEDGRRELVIARPDRELDALLSRGERDVVRSLLDGDSYARISDRRTRSPRTVANQLARAYAKLNVSGRLALLAHAVSFEGCAQQV